MPTAISYFDWEWGIKDQIYITKRHVLFCLPQQALNLQKMFITLIKKCRCRTDNWKVIGRTPRHTTDKQNQITYNIDICSLINTQIV